MGIVTIKTPQQYINKPGLAPEMGKCIVTYGKKALIIGSRTAYTAIWKELESSLSQSTVQYQREVFSGYPTVRLIEQYIKEIQELKPDMVIGIGGGKVCDLVKAVGNLANLPVITIPTIAATCAAWAARSIIYREDGDFDHIIWNNYTPCLVLADTKIIALAPSRYMEAGILDTFAKWYENIPNLHKAPENITLKQAINTSKLAFDILEQYGTRSVKEATENITENAALQTVDAIIYLAGAIGSFASQETFGGFAHPFYYATTRLPHTRFRLHGEKVAFGLLVQFVLENQSDKEFEKRLLLFDSYHMVFSLKDLGISEQKEEDVRKIAEIMLRETPAVSNRGYGLKTEDIMEGILSADRKVEKYQLRKQK